MTVQFKERFLLDGTRYWLHDAFGLGLVRPKQLGLKPVACCTACWRGYISTYSLRGNKLVLEDLHVDLGLWEGGRFLDLPGPEICGVRPFRIEPEPPELPPLFNNRYQGLGVPTRFTGELVLVRDLVNRVGWDYYSLPAWAYRTVLQLHFFRGSLVRFRSWCLLAKVMRFCSGKWEKRG